MRDCEPGDLFNELLIKIENFTYYLKSAKKEREKVLGHLALDFCQQNCFRVTFSQKPD